MIEKLILNTVRSYSLFPEGSTVTVGISGGADSVALLYALHSLKDELNITVKAAHLNHLIRGEEAFRDEAFVKKFCSDLNIPLFSERADVPLYAKTNKLSLETAAREVRYEFFRKINEGVIATAHTAGDNLETVILNLTRGCGPYGLCGIPIKRDNIVRPLIGCTRETIEDYCKKHSLSFVTDSTNLNDDYTRNKIRHSIVPVLKELNPQVEYAVYRTSRSMTDVTKMLKDAADGYINRFYADGKLTLCGFENLNPQIAKKIITDFVSHCDSEISLEACHIDEIYKICLLGGKTSIPKDKYCKCQNGILTLGSESKNVKMPTFRVNISEEEANFKKITENVNNLFLNYALDCDKFVGNWTLRTRKIGDKIRLLNRNCSKPLTKLYSECKIPLEIRDSLPVISDDLGVIWIDKIGVASRCAVSANTKKILKIDVKRDDA